MKRGDVYATNIEQKVKEWLNIHNVPYIFQRPTRMGYVDDFYIPNRNLILEVDGVNWHSSKEACKRDNFRDYRCKRAGYNVLRIKEEDMGVLDKALSFLIEP